MLSESHYWMFGNALLLLLDLEALLILLLHLWVNRREFSFQRHGVSLAFLVYIFGHSVFRFMAWYMWMLVSTDPNIEDVAVRMLTIYNHPLLKGASLLDMIGLIMIVSVLTWNVRFMWLYASSVAIALAIVSTWFA